MNIIATSEALSSDDRQLTQLDLEALIAEPLSLRGLRARLLASRFPGVLSTPADTANDLEPVRNRVSDPLRGLAYLGSIAVTGSDRIRALAATPVVYAWDDYAEAGTIVVLAGPPGGGKTTALFLLLLARAYCGAPIKFLNRAVHPAPPGKFVVLIEGEHGEASAARKLIKSARSLGLSGEETDAALNRIVIVARKAVTVGSKEWRDVESMIADGRVSDLALDTLARVAPGDANNEADQVAIFGAVASAIEKAPEGDQPVVWALTHTRKSGADKLEDVSGSAQRVGQADSVILVNPNRNKDGQVTGTTFTLAKAREEPEHHPEVVELTIVNGKMKVSAPTAKSDAKHTPEQLAKVRAAVEVAEDPFLVASEIIAEAGVKKTAGYSAMHALEKEGVLVARPLKKGKSNGWDRA